MKQCVSSKRPQKGRPLLKRPRFLLGFFAAFVLILLIVVTAVIGDTTYYDDAGIDEEMYFGMTILSGWPIESILPLEPSLTGYVFTHWSASPGGGAFDFTVPIMREMTFYANWQAEYEQ